MELIAILLDALRVILPDSNNLKIQKEHRKIRRYSYPSYIWYCFYHVFLYVIAILFSLSISAIFPNYWGIAGTFTLLYPTTSSILNFYSIIQARTKVFTGTITERKYADLTKQECNYRLILQLIATLGCFCLFLAGLTTFESTGLIWLWAIMFGWPPFWSLYDMYQKYQEWKQAQNQ